jgi:signal transduction histidine kinase
VVKWSRRRLLLAFGAVVLCFVAATTFAELRLLGIDTAVRDIAGKGLPSIQHLATVRTTLRQLEQLTADYVEAAAEGEPRSHNDIDAARRQLDERITAYLQGRPAVAEETRRAQGALNAAIARVYERVSARDFAGAHSRLLYDLGPAAQAFDEVVLSLLEGHVDGVYRMAMHIGNVRQRSMAFSFILDALAMMLTVLAAWLTLRTIRRYTDSLEAQSQILARRADELEEFAGRVAHDVLSPLSTVSLSLSSAEKIADPQVARMVSRGMSALARVEKIVDGLLAFARAGARPEPDARAELREAIEGVLEGTREMAAEAGVEVRTQPIPPIWVVARAGVLDSLVANLVRNAIKYMGDRPVRCVELRVSERNGLVRVEVEDTGPGLPPSLEEAVFEPYVRGAGADRPGIGLGLATVKRIARAHGGHVGVRSQPGRGSCFWFELPRASSPPATA